MGKYTLEWCLKVGRPCWDDLLTSHLPLHAFLEENRCYINSWWKWLILKYNRIEILLNRSENGNKNTLVWRLGLILSSFVMDGMNEVCGGNQSIVGWVQRQLSPLAKPVLAELWTLLAPETKGLHSLTHHHSFSHSEGFRPKSLRDTSANLPFEVISENAGEREIYLLLFFLCICHKGGSEIVWP